MGATSSAAQGQQGLHVGTGPYCPKALDLGTGGGSRVDPTGQSQATVQGGCRPGKLGASSLTLGYGATAGIGSRRAEAGAATSRMRPDLAELVQSGDPRGGCACGEGFFPVVSPLILRFRRADPQPYPPRVGGPGCRGRAAARHRDAGSGHSKSRHGGSYGTECTSTSTWTTMRRRCAVRAQDRDHPVSARSMYQMPVRTVKSRTRYVPVRPLH